MKLSRKFLEDYVDIPKKLTIKEIADAMTNIGNEYEDASPLINCTNLVVGYILECMPHPDSDHLKVCKVDIGNCVLDIVCGAPNCREGIYVIVALVGAHLPGGEIKHSKIRGVESNGMLCSIAELGLDNKFLEAKDKEGIHEFTSKVKIGTNAIEALGLDDEVIDFELTANRGDLLSILGMAYEIGAIYNKKVKDIDLSYNSNKEDINDSFKVIINTKYCPLFLAKKVKNVVIKESPDFIKNRLIASGIRPINNVVDISNYVMLETGQPLHYYDANKLKDTLIVRDAFDNEELVTLDNQKRTLSKDDIVIANNDGAVGLAGVMGGLSTEVTDETKDIIIESAIFDSIRIRKTSKKILRSEASNRFEKGLDPKRTYMAIERSCHLLEKYADAKIVGGMVEISNITINDKVIDVSLDKIKKVLGIDISKKDVESILLSLGFNVKVNKDILTVTVPTRRLDISIQEDLIEEVGRMYGMDKIVGKLPVLDVINGTYNKNAREIRNRLVNLGLNETLSYTLIPNRYSHMFTNDKFEEIVLADPMSEERDTLRYSLLYSLKEIYLYNKARNKENISIFELGKGFYKENGEYKEKEKLAVLMSGDYQIGINNIKVDFYYIKGILENLLDYLGFNGRYTLKKDDNLPDEFHPGQTAIIELQGKNVGIIGLLHPNVIKESVYVFELDIEEILNNHGTKMTYKEIPKYPTIEKDLAFVLDKDIPAGDIMSAIKKSGGKLLNKINIFDLYTGNNVLDNKKSIAFKLEFLDPTRTLTDEEVMDIFNKIINDIEKKFNAKLRS